MRWVDKRSCRKADLVITVGRDLEKTLEKRFKGTVTPKHIMINNWIDEKKIYPLPADNQKVIKFKRKYNIDNDFINFNSIFPRYGHDRPCRRNAR